MNDGDERSSGPAPKTEGRFRAKRGDPLMPHSGQDEVIEAFEREHPGAFGPPIEATAEGQRILNGKRRIAEADPTYSRNTRTRLLAGPFPKYGTALLDAEARIRATEPRARIISGLDGYYVATWM